MLRELARLALKTRLLMGTFWLFWMWIIPFLIFWFRFGFEFSTIGFDPCNVMF